MRDEPIRRALYDVVRRIGRGVDAVLLFLFVVSLLRIAVSYVPELSASRPVAFADAALGPFWAGLREAAAGAGLPRRLAGTDAGPILAAVLLLAVRNLLNWRLDRLAVAEYRRRAARGDAREDKAAPPAETDAERDARRRRAAARRAAVATYAEAKTILEATKRDLTFLSLDVAGSTRMKEGEDPFLVEQAFSDYRALVERALGRNGAVKSTWTPDGQMAAFPEPDAAVRCAKEILAALPEFNAKVSRLRTPFRFRAGAHCGVVSTDDETPMEAISDHAIDIAGHLQKEAEPGTLWISGTLHARLSDTTGFSPAGREVDGEAVFAFDARAGN